MTKNEIAKNINHKANIIRTIASDVKLDFIVEEIYDNRGKAESWQDNSCSSSFTPELNNEYEYTLYCNNAPCHRVDYENEEEVEILNAYESEGEVLVPSNVIMKIADIGTDEDFEELGYYPIELEFLGFKEE